MSVVCKMFGHLSVVSIFSAIYQLSVKLLLMINRYIVYTERF